MEMSDAELLILLLQSAQPKRVLEKSIATRGKGRASLLDLEKHYQLRTYVRTLTRVCEMLCHSSRLSVHPVRLRLNCSSENLHLPCLVQRGHTTEKVNQIGIILCPL